MPGHDHNEHRERMKARFAQNGLDGFAPHEVLELLLFFAIPRKDVNPLAHRLLRHFGSVATVLEASLEKLKEVPGIGEHSATLITLVAKAVRYAEKERLGERPVVTNYREAKAYCKHLFSGVREEVLYVICMDAQGRVLRPVPAIHGTIDEIPIYPRTIVKVAMDHDAHSVMLAHNHPSGVKEPSDADIHTTELLRGVFAGMDIAVLDHIIYADGECISMAQWQQIRRVTPLLGKELPKAADTRQARRGASAMHEMGDDLRYELLEDPETKLEEDA